MVWSFVAVFVMVVVAAAYVGKQYRSTIEPVWSPTLAIWRIIRLLGVVLIGYGLWISGKGVLQLLAVVGCIFVGFYLAFEQPHKSAS